MKAIAPAGEPLHGVPAERAAELGVIGHDAKGRLNPWHVTFGCVADGVICGMPASA